MSKKILFHVKKHGRYVKERPHTKGANEIDSEIIITNEQLIVKPKTLMQNITVPLTQIEEIIEGKKSASYWTAIFLRNGTKFHIRFFSNLSGPIRDLHEEFFNMLKVQVGKIKKEQELEELKKMQKPTNVFYINIPPQTKLTALKCPNCKAPLDYMPPCKCEHCGVMIELMK